jgi:hypothetical protein
MLRAVRNASLVAGLVVTAGLAAGATPAAAAPPTGPVTATRTMDFCPEWAEAMCLFYGSNYTGDFIGILDLTVNDYAHPALHFPDNTPQAGSGKPVWNDAGSAINYNTGRTLAIWTGVNRTGTHIRLNKYPLANSSSRTLGAVNNRNRSQGT